MEVATLQAWAEGYLGTLEDVLAPTWKSAARGVSEEVRRALEGLLAFAERRGRGAGQEGGA